MKIWKYLSLFLAFRFLVYSHIHLRYCLSIRYVKLLIKSILLIFVDWNVCLSHMNTTYTVCIYLSIYIYLYYIKFTYVFSSTISGLLNFAHWQWKSNNAASFGFSDLFCSVFFVCILFLLFLGFSYLCTIREDRAEDCSWRRGGHHLLGWRYCFKAVSACGPPLGLKWMEPRIPMLN